MPMDESQRRLQSWMKRRSEPCWPVPEPGALLEVVVGFLMSVGVFLGTEAAVCETKQTQPAALQTNL